MSSTEFRVSSELRAAIKGIVAALEPGNEAERAAKLEEAVRLLGQDVTDLVLKEVAARRREELNAAKIAVRGG